MFLQWQHQKHQLNHEMEEVKRSQQNPFQFFFSKPVLNLETGRLNEMEEVNTVRAGPLLLIISKLLKKTPKK